MAQAREYISARRQADSHLDKMGKIPCSIPLSAVDKSDKFDCLKQKIAAEQGQETGYLATNITCFDQALSGGLAYRHTIFNHYCLWRCGRNGIYSGLAARTNTTTSQRTDYLV